MQWLFCYLPKLKRSPGLASGGHCLHNVFMQMFLISHSNFFHCHTFFPSQDIKQNIKQKVLI